MYCEKCGKRLAKTAKFCANCGAPVANDAADTQSWPGAAEAQTAVIPDAAATAVAGPAQTLAAPSSASGSRRSWLLPVIIGAILIAAGLAALAIMLALRSDSKKDASGSLSSALAPVVLANQTLSNKLDSASSLKRLGGVEGAARTLEDEVIRAEGAISAIETNDAAKSLLEQALTANLAYARKVIAASTKLTVTAASTASDEAQRTASAYASVTASDRQLTVPAASSFSTIRQLRTLAEKESTRTTATAAIREYVNSIDSLLRNSVEARSDLGALISEAQNGTIGLNEARDRIAGVIAQRTSLQTEVAALSPPAPFVRAAELLRQSISASLDDDRAIQGLINAYFEDYDPSSFSAQHVEANNRATAAKQSFLATYNRLRTRYLKLSPLPLDLRY